MAMTDKDYEWLEPIREDLRQSVESIDAATRSRLTRIRHQALAHAGTRKFSSYKLPAAALATACLVLALVLTLPRPQPVQNEMLDDLDLITATESLELIEDLEFYEWLEAYDLPG